MLRDTYNRHSGLKSEWFTQCILTRPVGRSGKALLTMATGLRSCLIAVVEIAPGQQRCTQGLERDSSAYDSPVTSGSISGVPRTDSLPAFTPSEWMVKLRGEKSARVAGLTPGNCLTRCSSWR